MEAFRSKLYDVEHALVMYAYSFAHLPAFGIYDDKVLAKLGEVLNNCHIYLIGFVPVIRLIDAYQRGRSFVTSFSILRETHELEWPLPGDLNLYQEDGGYYLKGAGPKRYFPNERDMMVALRDKSKNLKFDVKYIGQAFGQTGERNAVDRLKRHETLQKISLQGVPDGFSLELLLLEVAPVTLVTLFNPFAKNQDEGDERIESGLDKLFGTDDRERIALYEASLIRYFKPKFNKEFKDSFPSTNMKILGGCYAKDFSAVVAEINFDRMPYYIGSDEVEPSLSHIAQHDLHEEQQRKAFFST